MAIIEMRRVRLFGPTDQHTATLEAVRRTGLLDPDALRRGAEPPEALLSRHLALGRASEALTRHRAQRPAQGAAPRSLPREDDAVAVAERVAACLSAHAELGKRHAALTRDLDAIRPWQGLNPADLPGLAQVGVHLCAYELPEDASFDRSQLDWFRVLPLDDLGRRHGLLALRLSTPPTLDLPLAHLPASAAVAIEASLTTLDAEADALLRELDALCGYIDALNTWNQHIADQLRLAEIRDSSGGDQEVFAMSGWCPAEHTERLSEALNGLPIALLFDAPREADDVPVKLRNPVVIRQFQPIISMFNLPDYHEWDPSWLVAVFMGVFFGFCLGDLGYGLILTTLGALALWRYRPTGDARLAVQWMMVLGLCTVVIGGAMGNVFGVRIYEWLDLGTEPLLFSLNDDPRRFFYASLLFGVVQLSVGLLIRLTRHTVHGMWQHALGTLGWLAVLPLVVALMAPTLAGSQQAPAIPTWSLLFPFGIILFFSSPRAALLPRIGGGLWGLYNVTSLLGDVMSYARIFGLGLSSGIIAMVVNIIAGNVHDAVPYLGGVLAALVLLIGHTFNFTMAVIGAVVHPARLQFLEFFGKFYEGGGRAYMPFRKLAGDEIPWKT